MDGGDAPVAVLTAALPPGIAVTAEDRAPLDTVTGYRDVLYGAGAVVLLLGLASLLISGIDRAMERRRHLAALTLLGVPRRVVRGSQLLQAAAPLVVGLPLAGGAGLLAGTVYLTLTGSRDATPSAAVTMLILGCVERGA